MKKIDIFIDYELNNEIYELYYFYNSNNVC